MKLLALSSILVRLHHRDHRGLGARRCAVLLVLVGAALVLGAVAPAAGPALSFSRAALYGAGSDAQALALGDVNGDGRLDLVTVEFNASDIVVLLNTGRGRFDRGAAFETGEFPGNVAIGDLNGDGLGDLVTTGAFGTNLRCSSAGVMQGSPPPRVPDRKRADLGRDRGPQRGRQGRPRHREPGGEQHVRAAQQGRRDLPAQGRLPHGNHTR